MDNLPHVNCVFASITNLKLSSVVCSVPADEVWPLAGIARQISVSSCEMPDGTCKQSGMLVGY